MTDENIDCTIILKKIQTDVINPVFKIKGFKKKDNTYYRFLENELIQLVNLQKSSWNSKEDISFTFNIGFFSKLIWNVQYEVPLPRYPKEYECAVSIRLGKLRHNFDYWYQLNKSSDQELLIEEIRNDITYLLNDILNNCNTLLDVWKFCNNNSWIISTLASMTHFVFLAESGDLEKATQTIQAIYDYNNKSEKKDLNYIERIKRAASKFGLTITDNKILR